LVLPEKARKDDSEYIVEIEEDLEENVYSKKTRAKLVEDGEMSNEEEGFMEGYDLEDDTNEEQ
jgi:hypothetical protein